MKANKRIYSKRLKSKPSEEDILRIRDNLDPGFVHSMEHANLILFGEKNIKNEQQ